MTFTFDRILVPIVILAGCPATHMPSDSGAQPAMDAATPADGSVAVDCTPIGMPGAERRCPSGCETIEGLALVWDQTSSCLRWADSNGIRPGEPLIAGCFPPGDHKRAGKVSCYTTGDDSFFIRTGAISPELLDQNWKRCSNKLAGHVADRMCEADSGTDFDAGW